MGCKGEMCRKALSPRPRSLLILARRGRGWGQANTYIIYAMRVAVGERIFLAWGRGRSPRGIPFPAMGKESEGRMGELPKGFPMTPSSRPRRGLRAPPLDPPRGREAETAAVQHVRSATAKPSGFFAGQQKFSTARRRKPPSGGRIRTRKREIWHTRTALTTTA